jgi:hypothetical protein
MLNYRRDELCKENIKVKVTKKSACNDFNLYLTSSWIYIINFIRYEFSQV